MSHTSGDTSTDIFDIAYECLNSFDRVAWRYNKPILWQSSTPCEDDLGRKRRDHLTHNLIRLRNNFSGWIGDTGAFSSTESSLDTKLRDSTEISTMVVELLEMVLRNLNRRECHGSPNLSKVEIQEEIANEYAYASIHSRP